MKNLHRMFPSIILLGVSLLALFTNNNGETVATHFVHSTMTGKALDAKHNLQPGHVSHITRLSQGGPDPRGPPQDPLRVSSLRLNKIPNIRIKTPGGPNPRHNPNTPPRNIEHITRLSPEGQDLRDNSFQPNKIDHITRLSPGGPDPRHHKSFPPNEANQPTLSIRRGTHPIHNFIHT